MQLPLVRQKRQMGMVAVASVLGTLVLVAGIAAVAFRMGSDKEAAAKSNDPKPDPTTTAVVPTTVPTTAPTPTNTVTAAPTTTTTSTPTPTTTATPTSTPTTTSIAALPTSNPKPTGNPTTTSTPTPQPKVEDKPKVDDKAGGSGTISIVCSPACDSVTVKGRNLGPSPVINVSFPAGTHPVVLKRSGAPPKSTSITVVAGKNTPLRVPM